MKIDIRKKTIIGLLAVEIGKIDLSFKLSTFMYLPNKIFIKLKIPKELISDHISFIVTNRQEVENYFMSLSDIRHQLLIINYFRKGRKPNDNILEKIKNIEELKDFKNSKDILELINEKEFIINNLSAEQKDIYINGYYHLLNFDLMDEKGRRYNDLSHGEKSIFGQLLNIYFYAINHKNLLFLFDEPEISLHPDWQKKYMSEVLNLLKKMEGKNHFIFTSHSPFLLSDIPKQNIIFLDKEENGNCKVLNHDEVLSKEQTFGANIHTLLRDSFFMEDGLMGEFAKSKINEIINFHKEVKKENKKEKGNCFSLRRRYIRLKPKFWQTQSIIGEEYLKQVVKNHLRDIENILLGHNQAKKEEITRLRKEADRLENM